MSLVCAELCWEVTILYEKNQMLHKHVQNWLYINRIYMLRLIPIPGLQVWIRIFRHTSAFTVIGESPLATGHGEIPEHKHHRLSPKFYRPCAGAYSLLITCVYSNLYRSAANAYYTDCVQCTCVPYLMNWIIRVNLQNGKLLLSVCTIYMHVLQYW